MINIYELVSNFIQNFLMVWFISNFCKYKFTGKTKNLAMISTVIIGTVLISVINRYVDYDGILSVFSVALFVIYAQMFLKEKIWVHIFISLFTMVIVFIIASLILITTEALIKISLNQLITEFSYIRLIDMGISRIIEFAVFYGLLYIKRTYILSYKEWILFSIVVLLTWTEIILLTNAALKYDEIKIYMFAASVAAVFINIIICYFVIYVNKAMKLKTEMELLTMQYKNVKHTEEKMKALYDSTYSLNHDLEKHFIYLKTMIQEGNNNKVISYIDDILENKLLKMQKIMFTDNDVFNAIINTRLEICRVKNIYPSINVDNNAIAEIKSDDITILFGNIFDNAIEAVEKANKKIIILNVQIQGEYVSIYMENSFDGKLNNELKTRKRNKYEHGFGLKNVKNIIEKYDGLMQCFTNKELFCCDILLKRNIK